MGPDFQLGAILASCLNSYLLLVHIFFWWTNVTSDIKRFSKSFFVFWWTYVTCDIKRFVKSYFASKNQMLVWPDISCYLQLPLPRVRPIFQTLSFSTPTHPPPTHPISRKNQFTALFWMTTRGQQCFSFWEEHLPILSQSNNSMQYGLYHLFVCILLKPLKPNHP